MRLLRNKVEAFEKFMLRFVGVCVAVVAILVVADIVSRAILKVSLGWFQTLDQWLVLGSSFLVVGVLLKTGDHTNINILPNRLSGVARKVIMSFNYAMVIIFGVYCTWSGVLFVKHLIKARITQMLYVHIPFWTVNVVVPVGMSILVVYAGGMLANTLFFDTSHKEGKEQILRRSR